MNYSALVLASWTLLAAVPWHGAAAAEAYPLLAGSYVGTPEHPRVFMSQADLKNLAGRINAGGSFSGVMFGKLAHQVKADMAADKDWDATYSGCDLDVYLHSFSYEPEGGYQNELRSHDVMRKALASKAEKPPPAGAAVVASRMALYAALLKAGAAAPRDAPPAEPAVTLAKRILLAWAERGFRGPSGKIYTTFCEGKTPGVVAGAALHIARGVVYSAAAQDLLQYLGAVSPAEEKVLDHFHIAMYDLVRAESNKAYDNEETTAHFGAVYNNQFASHLTSLLALARLVNDKSRFLAALYGNDGGIRVRLPWTVLFSNVIYGVNDHQRMPFFANTGRDALTSRPSFATPDPAPGEINDRYRNQNPMQAVGYAMATLEWLYDDAEILRVAGFDAFRYRGTRQQSLELATEYYACYLRNAGNDGTVITKDNANKCPDYVEYIGRKVNGVGKAVVVAAFRYPGNKLFGALEPAAKRYFPDEPFALDALRFGYWKN